MKIKTIKRFACLSCVCGFLRLTPPAAFLNQINCAFENTQDTDNVGEILYRNLYFDSSITKDNIDVQIKKPITWKSHHLEQTKNVEIQPSTDYTYSFFGCDFAEDSKNSKIIFNLNGTSSSALESWFGKPENNPSTITDAYEKSATTASSVFDANTPFSLCFLNKQFQISSVNLGFKFHVSKSTSSSTPANYDVTSYVDISKSKIGYNSANNEIYLLGDNKDQYFGNDSYPYKLSYRLSIDANKISIKYHPIDTSTKTPPYFEILFDENRKSLFKECRLSVSNSNVSEQYAEGNFEINMDTVWTSDWLKSIDVPVISTISFSDFETGSNRTGFKIQFKKGDDFDTLNIETKQDSTTEDDLVIPISNITLQQINGMYLNDTEKSTFLSSTKKNVHISYEYDDFSALQMSKYNIHGRWTQVTSPGRQTGTTRPGGWTYIQYPSIYETIDSKTQQEEYDKILNEELASFVVDGKKVQDRPYSRFHNEFNESSEFVGIRIQNAYWKYGSMFEKLSSDNDLENYFEDKAHEFTIHPYFNWIGQSKPIKMKDIHVVITKQWNEFW